MTERLLELLQKLMSKRRQTKQIQCVLITKGLLLHNTISTHRCCKWKPTVLINTLIRAHLCFKEPHHSLHLFTLMLSHNVPPNSHTFPPLLKASTHLSAPFLGHSLHTHVLKRGVLYDPFVQTSLLALYSTLCDLPSARKVFDEIANPCVVECNALIDAFAKNGDVGSALLLFISMAEKDVVSWTTIVHGLFTNARFVEAISVFRSMIMDDDVKCGFVRPNEATFVTVIASCSSLDTEREGLYFGKQLHAYLIRTFPVLTIFMGTALVALYGKFSHLDYAFSVFNQMETRGVCTWNAMISSLASNSKEEEAIQMFETMNSEEGLCPNEVTFVALLTACARVGLVDLGLDVLRSMSSEFGVVPVMEHCGCVVDLLGRAGLLREAKEFIERMPFEPDDSVFGALLGACKIHGENELGIEASKRVVEMKPQHNGGVYVALSSLNFGLGRWDSAADARKDMANVGIRKIPAYSLIV